MTPRFLCSTGPFWPGTTALHWPTPFPTATRLWSGCLHHTADLIILDVYMPRMTGLELLRTLRMEGIGIDVIMVTAANDSKTVDALLKLGVTDYLVKPFAASRFQQALDTFCQHREAVSHDNVSQQELDALFPSAAPAVSIPRACRPAPWTASAPVCARFLKLAPPARPLPTAPAFPLSQYGATLPI